jgi:hypothetical protein
MFDKYRAETGGERASKLARKVDLISILHVEDVPAFSFSQEEALMWARRLKIAYFFIFWLNRAKFDRACECPANGPAWSSMVPHVQHAGRCGTLREFAGICWTIAGICWTLRDTGHRARDTAGGWRRRRRRPATPSPWRPNPFAP